MEALKTNFTVDAKGLACPMPIVKTKKAINDLNPGEVLEVLATDKGSKADIQAWAKSSGHQYLGTIEEGEVLKHYIRKASANEEREAAKFEPVASNEELQTELDSNSDIVVLDVREPAEFAFGHIPNAVSIPFGELEERIGELNKDKKIYVVCRTGSRSDMASQTLTEKGFTNVINVVPGMSEWNGPTETKVN
ncbi:sulfurtransferase TusA family protein [Bacillus sp. ISL-47]|uniref:sulfurtransferase TusA family protein n=1 Tax=Bacillus sp. ISL-47 TaxID=2819130 RepID=UPI001BECEDA6|nr:sulfurtransferase TusA family protein [Bacillus sp. ISL-47]MBT2690738.1 sulfurtransferase TusA family protein [Bacillus sp. ISL-47]MBT2709682.1 sulfurtransferase TusA family protein [Pseudomonas sp. ISL-84]